jgi:hypothetical protein
MNGIESTCVTGVPMGTSGVRPQNVSAGDVCILAWWPGWARTIRQHDYNPQPDSARRIVNIISVAILVVLTIIAVALIMGIMIMMRELAAIRSRQEAAQRTTASRDLGPAIHGIVQQLREVSRLLTNIDKRLEKLEVLQKMQIANVSLRQDKPASRS